MLFINRYDMFDGKSPAVYGQAHDGSMALQAREMAAKVMDGKIVVGHSLQNDFQEQCGSAAVLSTPCSRPNRMAVIMRDPTGTKQPIFGII